MSLPLRASPASLPLPFADPPSGSGSQAPPGIPERTRQRRLWLCLEFQGLPLEIFLRTDGAAPAAVIESAQGGYRVRQASPAAERQGVLRGLGLNAALALCPTLMLKERDQAGEAAAIERLAAWAGQFTSLVSIEPPRSLLLEIHGSLRLFGGLEGLGQILDAGVAAMGFTPRRAVAPTPRAALWLARGADGAVVTEPASLTSCLGRLPLIHTGWPEKTLRILEEMGVVCVFDCLRLPRDGFARRLGPARLADLDRALGRLPEPRTGFRAPETYEGRLELPAETMDSALICRGMQRLLAELEGFLRARGAGVQQPVFGFLHVAGEPTWLTLPLSRPSDSAALLAGLLSERLERCRFPAPVIDLSLTSGPVTAVAASQPTLADGRDTEEGQARGGQGPVEDGRQLVDRLRARLGDDVVRGVCLLADHRPERAWRYRGAGVDDLAARGPRPMVGSGQVGSGGQEALALYGPGRPLWILERPRHLPLRDERPWLDGRLTLREGPERIESGWWDGADVSRDYFVASNPAGTMLWIYRERRAARRWFLHGVFG